MRRIALQSVTSEEVKSNPIRDTIDLQKMHLTMAGVKEEALTKLSTLLDMNSLTRVSLEQNRKSPLNPFSMSLERTGDGEYRIIDGKIWMKEPNWINTSRNGKTLGADLKC